MKKCAILFLMFIAVLVLAAVIENGQSQKEELKNIETQELTLLDKK